MNVALESREKVWRGRGRPRRHIPQEIISLADATYRTGNVGTAHVNPGEEADASELVSLLKSYATHNGKRMKVQRDGDTIRFEMVDKRPYTKREVKK